MLKRLIRRVSAVTVFGVLAVAGATPAAADIGGQVDCTAYSNDPRCVVVVVNPGGGGGGGGGGSISCAQAGRVVPCYDPDWGWLGSDGCRYQLDPDPSDWVKPPPGKDPASGAVFMRTCPRMGGRDESVDAIWMAYRDAPILGAVLNRALDELRLPRPAIRTSPATTSPQVVFVPTWLWIESGVWHDYVASAAVPGLRLTATAIPVSVSWSMGDGANVACGQGTAWTAGSDPAAASPDCGHTFTRASRGEPGGDFTVRATITWRVTWAGGGASGVEPALTSTSSVRVQVLESAAVNTGAR